MPIGADILERTFANRSLISMFFGEASDQTLAIEIMHDLRSRTMRDIKRTLIRETRSGTSPVLIIDCQLRFTGNLGCRELCSFIQLDPRTQFSHYTWHCDHESNRKFYELLSKRIGFRNAYIRSAGYQKATECFYPVNRGERLAIVHFAI